MAGIRKPIVCGDYYPANADELTALLSTLLSEAKQSDIVPRALVSPYSQYSLCGPVMAAAFAPLKNIADKIERVVVIAPCLNVSFEGIAAPTSPYFETPFGHIPLNEESITSLEQMSFVRVVEQAHEEEHTIEVLLPFLQHLLGDFELLPFLVSRASPLVMLQLIEYCAELDNTMLVLSCEVSPSFDKESATRLVKDVSKAVELLDSADIGAHHVTCSSALKGLLLYCQRNSLKATTLKLSTSAHCGGPNKDVVGFGAWAFA